tara:strand:+ start:7551 stop:10529 length:2979 start_codon:yes stop_codon:yes gene_type:complete
MKNLNSFYSVFTFFLVSIFVNSFAYSLEIPESVPTPAWVKVNSPNLEFDQSLHELEGGIYYLLVDTQIKVDSQQSEHYFYHYANHITNQSGVESNSQLNISFDPIYEEVFLHKIKILRNGKEIDQLRSSKKQLIQREDQLDQLIYNGLQTLNIILNDVRAGDTIEYSYSLIGANPVYKGIFSTTQSIEWDVPVEDVFFRLVWNKPTELNIASHNTNLELSEKKTTLGREYVLHSSKVKGKSIEKGSPIFYDPWAKLYFNELNDWADVAKWGLSLYDDVYKSSIEIDALALEFQERSSNQADQVSMALRFVQNEIRYLGIELGSNSHIPSPAYETLDRRYGDCKDKTVLLITLLKRLGIQASPVLVNTDMRAQLSQLPATPKAFNHVITQVTVDGKDIYIDPTRSYQSGDLGSIYYPNYGSSLVLKPNTKMLTSMPPASTNSSVIINEKFVLPDTPEQAVLSTTHSLFKGLDAERQRSYQDGVGSKKFQADFLSFFQQYYSGSEVDREITFEDNTQNNELSTTEYYKIHNLWVKNKETEGRFDATFYANILNSYIDYQDARARKDPLYISHPTKVIQNIEIKFPDQHWEFDDETFSKNTEFFNYSYDANYDVEGKTLRLSYAYETKVNVISPLDYPAYFEALESIANYASYSIYWTPYKSAAPELSQNEFQLTPTHLIFIYLGLTLAVVILWRIDKRRFPDPENALFFPVQLPKLIVMWVLTFGTYGAYWFYRNFKYIKQHDNKPSMPIARGIFSYFWYYPLWRRLKEDSLDRHDENHLPPKGIAILLAVLFLVSVFANEMEAFTIPALVFSALLVLPLANYILYINHDKEASKHNSRWTYHHYLLILVSLPICLLTVSSELGLTPNDSVIEGKQLLEFDVRKFQQKGIVGADEPILYFYSNAFLSNQDDGNGFTEHSVFSFWKDESGDFNIEKAHFNDISDIRTSFSEEYLGTTTLTVERYDGSEFILFVSNNNKKDVKFATDLRHQWSLHK